MGIGPLPCVPATEASEHHYQALNLSFSWVGLHGFFRVLESGAKRKGRDSFFLAHLCVGFLFLVLYPVRLLLLFRALRPRHSYTYNLSHTHTHNARTHTHTLSHIIFHMQLATHTHAHNFVTHSFVTHTHNLSHTALLQTFLPHTHNFATRTQSFTRNFVTHIFVTHTQLCHT